MFLARSHSHSIAPAIEEALQTATANVRSDSARDDWVLCGFEGNDIRLIGTGVGGIEVLKKHIVPSDVCYGLVRCAHRLEQAGYVQTDFIKFVWVYWRPDNIPVARKMRIGVNEGEMKTLFSPYHAELHACAIHDVGEKALAEVLDSVTMSADRTGKGKPAPLERAASSPMLLARGHAAWKQARSSLLTEHFAQLALADEQKKASESATVGFDDPEAFAEAIRAVRSDVDATDWCLVGYEDETVLRMVGEGTGGLEALLDAAEPSGVNYGLLRISEQLDLVFHEAYCFITWMPENIPAFAKARVSTHQGAVAVAFRNHVHCQFYFRGSDRSDINMGVIRNRVRQIIGKGERPRRSRKNKPASAPTNAIAEEQQQQQPMPMRMPMEEAATESASTATTASIATSPVTTDAPGGAFPDDGSNNSSDSGGRPASPASQEAGASAGARGGAGRGAQAGMGEEAGEEAAVVRAAYTAPKTKTKSLRGSIVIKTDSPSGGHAPTEEEISHFPKMFLNGLFGDGGWSGGSSGGRGGGGEAKSRGEGGGGGSHVTDTPEETPQQQEQPAAAAAAGTTTSPSSTLTSVQEAVQRVRMGGDGVDYLVVEWRRGGSSSSSNNSNNNNAAGGEEQLEIKEIGTGGVQALADCLERNSVMYGLVRVRVTETTTGGSRSNGNGNGNGSEKFCCVKWAPEDGSADHTTPELQGQVSRLFHPYHGDLTAKHAADVTPEAVSSRVTRRLKQ